MLLNNYLLTIKRNKGDFIPIEWNYIKKYEDANICSLMEIDKFTSKYDENTLHKLLVKSNLIESNDICYPLVIISKNGKSIYETDVIYKDKKQYLEGENIKAFLIENNDKLIYNKLYNYVKNIANPSDSLILFISWLKKEYEFDINSIDIIIENCLYEEKRKIALFIYNKLLTEVK